VHDGNTLAELAKHRVPEGVHGAGGMAYLPTPRQHDLGGYETWLGTNRVEREASVKITAREPWRCCRACMPRRETHLTNSALGLFICG